MKDPVGMVSAFTLQDARRIANPRARLNTLVFKLFYG
jgi:hypothetical protein